MPVDTTLSMEVWLRYQYLRDNGHNEYIAKADKCEKFFRGLQWETTDLARLQEQRRPALTINKILSTISNVLGEQIYNRTDISFQPRDDQYIGTADALNKVYRQIMDNNQLEWRRSDMFCDGVITSRGFLDTRLDFTDSMQGEVRITNVNPKNVLIDADADSYDPDEWNDVLTTKWMTWRDISILYNEADALLLKDRNQSWFQYGFDSIERTRDRFGPESQRGYFQEQNQQGDVLRNIRVIEMQKRKVSKQKHFVNPATGDMRAVPDSWDRNKIAAVASTYGLQVVDKLVKRIRWSVIADNVRLHDDWSPFEHFTIVPFFPYFRRGKTVGLVENLIDPQELLNKVTSQELHVVNTTANSGWKIREGALRNMTQEELKQRGAETGLVMVLDEIDHADKIQPNQVPSGLDRVSYKAEEHIKTISGVSDYQTGAAREDVSAKAVQENLKRGSLNQAKSTDSLSRTDFMLARNVLSLVQRFYTEPRLVTITSNRATGERQSVAVNQPTGEGSIANDLTVGEFQIIVTSVPHRQTLEAQQFDQAVSLREQGVPIPDKVLIAHSALFKKDEILKDMEAQANSAEAQFEKRTQVMGAQLQLANLKADAAKTEADAVLKQAKARKEATTSAIDLHQANGGGEAELELEKTQAELDAFREKARIEIEIKRQELELKREELALKRQEMELDLGVKREEAAVNVQATHEKHAMNMSHMAESHKLKLQQEKANAAARKRVGSR